jgi:LuxR family quorum sensing-dependent transcriptional regulator
MTFAGQAMFDLVDQVAAASTVSEIWGALFGVTQELGLQHGQLNFVLPSPQASTPIIASAMPKGWLEGYEQNNLNLGDMELARARASTNSFEWQMSDWAPDKMTPIQRRWREHCLMFGITGGLSVLDFHPNEEVMLRLCCRKQRLSTHDRLALCFAGHEVIHRIREIVSVEPVTSAVWLSQREQQCLEWAAAGKTDWEIGQILSLSEKTVNVYITRAKAKFSVKTRAQAILRAVQSGKISARI